MNTIANNLPLISVSLLPAWFIIVILFHLPKVKSISVGKRFIFVFIIFVFIRYMPIYEGMSIAYILRGMLSDLSITTMLLFATFLYGEIQRNNNCYKISNVIWFVIFITDLILCLSVFGCIPFDIYSSGYFPKGLLIFYLIAQFLFWQLNKKFVLFWLLALIGYIFKVLPSPNLWDYLMDPVLWLISLFYLAIFGLRKLRIIKFS